MEIKKTTWAGIIALVAVTGIVMAVTLAYMWYQMVWFCACAAFVIAVLTISFATTKKKGFLIALITVATTVSVFLIYLFVRVMIEQPN